MNKLSKILICIIVVLTIALAIMTYSYIKVRQAAKDNLNNFLQACSQVYELQKERNQE